MLQGFFHPRGLSIVFKRNKKWEYFIVGIFFIDVTFKSCAWISEELKALMSIQCASADNRKGGVLRTLTGDFHIGACFMCDPIDTVP